MGSPILDATALLFNVLEPLAPEERVRTVTATFALLGQTAPKLTPAESAFELSTANRGPNAQLERWMAQNAVTSGELETVLHVEGDTVEIITGIIPGATKKLQTTNCYLLVGLRELVRTGIPKFAESEVVALCQQMGCYDKSNHAAIRKGLGNIVLAGKEGHTLPAPGMRAAAELVKTLNVNQA